MLPVIIDASSDNMSPKMLFVTIVSNCSSAGNLGGQYIFLMLSQDATNQTNTKERTCLGFLTSCIAALSTYMCESSISGNSEASAVTLRLQSMDAYNNIGAKEV